MLARPGLLVLVDLGRGARADDLRHRVRAEQDEAAVVDLERVAVERPHRRARDAVALGFVLAAVARTAVAGGDDRIEGDLPVLRALLEARRAGVLLSGRPVRLDGAAQMDAVVRDDREARLLRRLAGLRILDRGRAVVPDERGSSRHLALRWVDGEGSDVPLADRELLDRAEIDLVLLLVEEGRQEREAGDRHRDDAADHAAEAERGALEEAAPRHGGLGDVGKRDSLLVGGRRRHPRAGLARLPPLGLDDERMPAQLGGRVARPEDPEDDGDRRADRGDQLGIDDQADENDDDADREADRPQRRRRQMRLLVERLLLGVGTRLPRLHQVEVLSERRTPRGENQPGLLQAVFGPAARHALLDLDAHLDLVGPRPCALLRPLRGRVDPELAADELPLRRVVEMVERPLADHDVALGVDVGACVEEHLRVVVHVDVLVHDDDALREAQHPEPPDRRHHLPRLAGELLANRNDAAVVERAGDRQVVVHDLGHGRAYRRQEDPLRRLAEPRVLLHRLPHDDRRIDRVAPHGQRGDVKDGERLGRRVVAGVVAERALAPDVVLLDVALEHDLGPGRNLDADADAPHELDGLAAQEAGEHELVDVLRQRRAGRVRGDRVEAQRDRDLDASVGREVVGAAVLVDLPVHEGRRPVDDLHPVHADVAPARARVVRDHGRERDERRRVARPAALDREQAEIHVVAAQDDLLAGALADGLRPRVGDRLELLQSSHLLHQPARRLHLEHVGDALRHVVEALHAEREAHATLGAELVDQERMLGALRALEQQRRPAGLHRAIDDLRDLQVGVDLYGDAGELALALEQRDPVAEVLRRHVASLRTERVFDGASNDGPRLLLARTRTPRHRRSVFGTIIDPSNRVQAWKQRPRYGIHAESVLAADSPASPIRSRPDGEWQSEPLEVLSPVVSTKTAVAPGFRPTVGTLRGALNGP